MEPGKGKRPVGRPLSHPPEKIERCKTLYEISGLNWSDISKREGVPRKTVMDWAKRFAWTRDLGEKIRQRTDVKLLGHTSRKPIMMEEQDLVESAADARVALVLEHRDLVAEAQARAREMLYQADDPYKLRAVIACIKECIILGRLSHGLDASYAIEEQRKPGMALVTVVSHSHAHAQGAQAYDVSPGSETR